VAMLSVRAATEVAYELATSLAPLPKALKTKAIEVKARIQSYLAVATGAMVIMELD
jgi:NO-binding membrane sensor protein with MHYT domain